METYRYNLKCLACSLHYQVYSWKKDWCKEAFNKDKVYCPECSKKGTSFCLGIDKLEGEICEYVPSKESYEKDKKKLEELKNKDRRNNKISRDRCLFCNKKLTEDNSRGYAPYLKVCEECYEKHPRHNKFPFPEL